MQPTLLFNSRINTGLKWGFIIMFSGNSDRMLGEWDSIPEDCFGVTAVGNRCKWWERSLETTEGQTCLTNRGWARQREPRSLRMWGKNIVPQKTSVTSICWLWKHFICCTHHGNGWLPPDNLRPYVLCQILFTDLISEPMTTEKLQKVVAAGQIFCHINTQP